MEMERQMLNPQSPIPLYRQLADLLQEWIRNGDVVPGSRIPSEHQLATEHGIGRPTVRQAIDQLVRKGLLTRRRGAGTFVRAGQPEVDLFSLDGTSASFRKKGVAVETGIVIPIRLQKIRDAANPFNGERAYFLSRLTVADDTPVLVEDLYLHADLFAGIETIDLQGRSLSAVAEDKFYLRPSSGRQSFATGYLKGQTAKRLQVGTRTPVLVVKRYLHFPQRANGVFVHLWCRTDQFVFTQNIGGVNDA
jgi:GntR family transcriptional regulator